MSFLNKPWASPGYSTEYENNEGQVFWQTWFLGEPKLAPHPVISSSAIDAGNTPTTILRPGLIMARLSTGKWIDYDSDASDGSEVAAGVLISEVQMYDHIAGAASESYRGVIAYSGAVKAASLLNLDYKARKQLSWNGLFIFDDYWHQRGRIVPKDDSYTVLASDNGTLFTTTGASGAVTFTLPSLGTAANVGLEYEFLNTVDQNMVVASADGDDIVGINDLSLDSITFSTASNKIGANVKLRSVYLGTTPKWLYELNNAATATLTS